MAKDRGGSFFAALLVTCGILSFGLLEWRLSKMLSHHPTEHEGDGPWLKPRVYHRRRNSEGVGSGASSATSGFASPVAVVAASLAFSFSLIMLSEAGRTEMRSTVPPIRKNV